MSKKDNTEGKDLKPKGKDKETKIIELAKAARDCMRKKSDDDCGFAPNIPPGLLNGK